MNKIHHFSTIKLNFYLCWKSPNKIQLWEIPKNLANKIGQNNCYPLTDTFLVKLMIYTLVIHNLVRFYFTLREWPKSFQLKWNLLILLCLGLLVIKICYYFTSFCSQQSPFDHGIVLFVKSFQFLVISANCSSFFMMIS